MSPLRRRMPDVFDHGSNLKWSARQDLHLRSLGPKPSVLLLHYALSCPDGLKKIGTEDRDDVNLGNRHRGEI